MLNRDQTPIDNHNSPLRAAVVQASHQLALNVVDLLEKMHRGRNVPTRTVLHAKIREATDT